MNPRSTNPNEIDLTARPRSTRVAWWIVHTITLLVTAGCLASFVAGPEHIVVRMLAGAFGLMVVLLYVVVWGGRHRVAARMVVDHEGIRLRNGHGKVILRLAWTELSGVGVMTNEVSRYWQQRDARNDLVTRWVSRRTVRVPIWLELYPANPEAVKRHPELELAWKLGQLRATGEEQRWLVSIGDGRGQSFPIGEAVQRWRPQLWRGHRSGSIFFPGGHRRHLDYLARHGHDVSPR
jgi:hypothetical protein